MALSESHGHRHPEKPLRDCYQKEDQDTALFLQAEE